MATKIRNLLKVGVLLGVAAVQPMQAMSPVFSQAPPPDLFLRAAVSGLEGSHPEAVERRDLLGLARRPQERDKRNDFLFAGGAAAAITGLVFASMLYTGEVCDCSNSRREGLTALSIGVSITGALVAIYAISQRD